MHRDPRQALRSAREERENHAIDGADGRGHPPTEPSDGNPPLEIIAAGRPLPDVLHALCSYLETAAADWERREGALRRSEAFLAQAQRLTRTASVWWRPSTGEVVWSDENYRLMGYPVGVMPTVELALDRCYPSDLQFVQETLSEAVGNGANAALEHRLLMPDGTVKHVRVVLENVGSPEAPEYVGAATDITAWKEAEERLRRSEAYLAEAQRLSSTGTFGWAVGEDCHFWSDETCRIFDYERSAPITRRAVLDRVLPEDVELVRELIADAEAGRHVDREFRLLLPDGSLKHVRLVAHQVHDRDGRAEVVGALQDVTLQRRSEEALARIQSELAQVSKVASIGALTASIAHEVNQPLTAIVTNASTGLRMLASDPANVAGAREMARRTIRDAVRTSEVMARLRALLSRRPPTAEPVALNEATREVLALTRSELQRGRVRTRLELADDLPLVLGDRIQLQQVIINLLRNAVEAMTGVEDCSRELVVRTTRDGDHVSLTVSDSGMGLDPTSTEQLFDAFYSTKPGGMGIGLSVSRWIIESHRGRLWAVANAGPGATFGFSIPPCTFGEEASPSREVPPPGR